MPQDRRQGKVFGYSEIALLAIFSGLSIMLHIFQWPYPLATFLKFDLAGVPIAVLTLLNMRLGLISLLIFWIGSVALTTDPTKVIGPTMKVVAEASTALPLALAIKALGKALKNQYASLAAFTVSLISRVSITTLLNYLVTPYWLVWAGWLESFEAAYKLTLAYLPAIALFNAIVVCYVASLSLSIFATLKKYFMF